MDPLAQLRDIHLPDPVSAWPPAFGWWLLAAVLLLGMVVLIYLIWRHFKKNLYRRAASKALIKIWETYHEKGDISFYLNSINMLLKNVSVNSYQKEDIAKLTGEPWLAFLDETADTSDFSSGPGKVLATAPYRPSIDVHLEDAGAERLFQCSSHWIRKHR